MKCGKTCELQLNNEQNDHDHACKSQKALMLEAQEICGESAPKMETTVY